MMKTAVFALLALACVAPSSRAAVHRDCGSTATLHTVTVPGCTAPPCVVEKGETIDASFNFTANAVSNTLSQLVTGTYGGATFPWPGDLPAPCDSFTVGNCPLAAGELVEQHTPLFIDTTWPSINSVIAKWNITDDSSRVVVCFTVEIKLINPPGK